MHCSRHARSAVVDLCSVLACAQCSSRHMLCISMCSAVVDICCAVGMRTVL